ncbi:hypothetical protein FIU89_15045 [Roseovarius sp. THAF27]|nr:hypothetical protein [Roseovarius sp. THAF27]QFT81939.1 hypothetical protein FIU89_15045 [Roseovarius sp. THAF27]
MSKIEADTYFDVEWADQIDVGEQSFKTQDDKVMTLLVAKSGSV